MNVAPLATCTPGRKADNGFSALSGSLMRNGLIEFKSVKLIFQGTAREIKEFLKLFVEKKD